MTTILHVMRSEEEFNLEYLGLKGLTNAVTELLEFIVSPSNQEKDTRAVGKSTEVFVPRVLAYSLDSLYANLLLLSEVNQHLASGVLSRSILEIMANVGWLNKSVSNEEFHNRCDLMFNQSVEVDKLVDGKKVRIKSLQELGAGSITDRLTYFGGGWSTIYRHLNSYAHMDTGFAVHYMRGEILGMRNLFVVFSSASAVESAKKLQKNLKIKMTKQAKLNELMERAGVELEKYQESTNKKVAILKTRKVRVDKA